MTRNRWEKIEELYHSARLRNGHDRAAYLKEACAGDEALRQEVESLLMHDQGVNTFLEEPALVGLAKGLAKDTGQSLIGREIGSYQVIALLGTGGMGEVYQAHDTRLGRDVAIKVLAKDFAHDAERLTRFQREAKMLASLNHPNIATIHGLEESNGTKYLVMELIPGETLAERLSAGALSIQDAIKVSLHIAEALEAAHEKGVIHRDLKPANVKVTPEGRVKVLDFGLAKAFASDGAVEISQMPTLSEDGLILGTPAYMSPEQARGKAVDKRTDIWAFGCLFYELLVGKPAFRGETISDTLAKVLEREPDWEALPVTTPVNLQELLHRCLEKDAQRRLRDIGDARIELHNTLDDGARRQASREKRFRMSRRAALGTLAGATAGAAGIATSVWYFWPAAAKPLMRLSMDVAPAQQFAGFT